jgi:hypothetical protein
VLARISSEDKTIGIIIWTAIVHTSVEVKRHLLFPMLVSSKPPSLSFTVSNVENFST